MRIPQVTVAARQPLHINDCGNHPQQVYMHGTRGEPVTSDRDGPENYVNPAMERTEVKALAILQLRPAPYQAQTNDVCCSTTSNCPQTNYEYRRSK
jgi:hypothetical protein